MAYYRILGGHKIVPSDRKGYLQMIPQYEVVEANSPEEAMKKSKFKEPRVAFKCTKDGKTLDEMRNKFI